MTDMNNNDYVEVPVEKLVGRALDYAVKQVPKWEPVMPMWCQQKHEYRERKRRMVAAHSGATASVPRDMVED